MLLKTGLHPRQLKLEITETALVEDNPDTRIVLDGFQKLGISLSLDDFGTGYSSLSYLCRYSFDAIKIDRSFIIGLPQDESDRAIVSATIAMAQALKLAVVAEGVETQAQMDCLRELDCASYQGFLCSPAMPADAFARWMAAQSGN